MLVSRDESRVTWHFEKQTTHFSLFHWTIQCAGPVQQTAGEFPRMKARVIKKEMHCDEAVGDFHLASTLSHSVKDIPEQLPM